MASAVTIQWQLTKTNGGWHVQCDILVGVNIYSLGGFKSSLEDVQCAMSYFPASEKSWTEDSLLEEWKKLFDRVSTIGRKSTAGRKRSGSQPAAKSPNLQQTSLFGTGI